MQGKSGLLPSSIRTLWASTTSLIALQAHSALDPLMPLLVDRLGDSNALFLDRWGSWGHGSFSETAAESTGAPSCLHGVVCRSVLARSTYGLCSVGGVEWRRRLLGLAERDGANFASGTVSAAQPAAWGSFLRFHEVASGEIFPPTRRCVRSSFTS